MDKVLSFIKGISPKAWIIIAIIVILIIVIIIYIKNKSVPEKPIVLLNAGISPQSVFPLKYGSRGDKVKLFQGYLNSKIGYTTGGPTDTLLVLDGIWGPLTEAAALKYWQKNTVSEIDWNSTMGLGKSQLMP